MADTFNFGLKGVGNTIQLGKAGPRLNLSGSVIQARNAADGAFVIVRGLDPVGDSDLATKLYVDSVAQGLDAKESCAAATTANLANFTTASGGQFTAVAATLDGVTLAEGDRVLVKDQSTQSQNGIYVVTATTTTLIRATDHNTSAEITAGNFVFVTEGTVAAGTGWVLQGPDPLTMNSSNLVWVQFSGAGTYTAGTGLTLTGTTFDLDFSELTSASVIATGDELIFQDGGVESRITVANFLADRDIVTATANGVLVRTAADTYSSVTITASAVAGDEGISIVNGDGVSGNPTIGIDIQGTSALGEAVATGDSVLMFNTSAGTNVEATVDQLKTFMNAGTSSTSITEGDTTVAVSDAGSGTVTTTIDGAVQITSIAASTTFDQNVIVSTGNTLTVADLTNNDVLIAGTGGLVEDSGGALTFDGSVLALTGDLTVTQSAYLVEQAAAGADTATQGQIWVRNDVPNTLMFTDDAGNDFTVNNVLEIEYSYSSAVTSTDPGAGVLNFNTVTIGSIATLYIDDVDNTGRDNSFMLANLGIGDLITFRSAFDPADYLVASVTSVTDSTGFWTIGLSPVHTGTIFTNGDQLRLSVEWQSQGVAATPTLITVADSTDTTSFPAFFESATGDLAPKTDASNYTYNATSGNLAAVSFNGVALSTAAGAGNYLNGSGSYVALTSNATHTGQVTGATALSLAVTAITDQPASGALVGTDTILVNDGGVLSEATMTQVATFTNATAGTVTSSGSPLSNEVAVFTSGTDIDSDSTFTWDATTLTVNELSFAGDTISNNTTDQPIIIRPNGTGSIIFQNGSSEEILELNDTVSAVNGLAITAGATGVPAQIRTGTGSEANIDIGFLTNGTGVISVTAGSGNYEDNVTADDDIPNKKYVDDAIQAVGGSGSLDSVTGTVSLTAAATVNIGAATGIPANCTILSVTLDVTVASDAATTVTVGDATNGAASYMVATENDPQTTGIYIADGRLLNGGAARQATATVATPGATGTATCIITFRHA